MTCHSKNSLHNITTHIMIHVCTCIAAYIATASYVVRVVSSTIMSMCSTTMYATSIHNCTVLSV